MMKGAASDPLVSIVVPAYNEARHIGECLESILAQTYQNWECTVANNRSTDATGNIARSYAARDSRIKVYDNREFLPAVANFNEALRKISPEAKYCKVVFADDWIFSECLERMVQTAEQFPTVGIVGAYGMQGSKVMWEGLQYPSHFVPGRDICRKLFLQNLYICGSATSVLYRADLVRKKDPFFNESNLHSDLETSIQLLRDHDFGFVHQILSFTREEEPGCLRTISEDLHTYVAGRFLAFALYGREFLTEQEFQTRMKFYCDDYYAILAGGVLRRRGKNFWNFHKQKLAESGIGFSRVRLIRVLFVKTLLAILNPETLIEKCWQIATEISSRGKSVRNAPGDLLNENKPV